MLDASNLHIAQGTFSLTGSFQIERGNRVAVMGPSGAGKSTLLAALAGFIPLNGGDVSWEGDSWNRLVPGERPVSMLFQDNNLFPHMTAQQNVGLGIRPSLRLTTEETQRVGSALDQVGLSGFEDRKPDQLSGGQQSRVALARALVRKRPLMLLDEPFAALGPALKLEMLGLVRTLCDDTGVTLLMVTHDPADAEAICPHTLVVADGTVQSPQNTLGVLSDPASPLRAYLGTTASKK